MRKNYFLFVNGKKVEVSEEIYKVYWQEKNSQKRHNFLLQFEEKEEGEKMDALKILVVDDESRMRKLVKDFLVRDNFEVIEAADGEEAVDLFYSDKNIALIILDVMMPKMDGWEVCREIRKNSKVPIIMLTARGDERDELLGFELGVDEYISKPFSPKILVARVEAILQIGRAHV